MTRKQCSQYSANPVRLVPSCNQLVACQSLVSRRCFHFRAGWTLLSTFSSNRVRSRMPARPWSEISLQLKAPKSLIFQLGETRDGGSSHFISRSGFASHRTEIKALNFEPWHDNAWWLRATKNAFRVVSEELFSSYDTVRLVTHELEKVEGGAEGCSPTRWWLVLRLRVS